ncbi:MAG: glycosyltransferase family 4 protein [Magnetococcales bacterium]|nr:glycosyltransferase family 4 protein [Magnetococcales bacterium]
MNILLISSKYPPEYAGSGYRIDRTWRRLAAMTGWNWRVVCNSLEYDGYQAYDWHGVAVQRVSCRLQRHGAGGIRLRQALRTWLEAIATWWWLWRYPVDLVYVVGTSASTAAAIAWAHWRRLPLVVELVNTGAEPLQPLPGLAWLWRRYLQPRLRQRTLIVAISDKLRQLCQQRFGLQHNVWSRPNPVDEQAFYPADAATRWQLRQRLTPFAERDRVLVWVANFIPGKNQIFLLEVLRQLPLHYKLVLAGPWLQTGPHGERNSAYVARIRQQIDEWRLGDRVLLQTGFVVAADYVRLADVVTIPSLAEGLSTPMLEALACGLPVIANGAEPAFQQWIQPGYNGFLCPLDATQWADAIQQADVWPLSQRQQFAAAITACAATGVIDRQLVTLLQALVVLSPDAILDVSTCF